MTSTSTMFPAPTQRRPISALQRMSVAGLSIEFHTPQGAESVFSDGIESEQRLPPSALRKVYSVDDFAEAAPTEWPRSSHGPGAENIASYFAGVAPGQGMWFNFNNMASDTHHIAVVPSIQGVNPITGRPGSLGMEQYMACPVHNVPFSGSRHCSQCGYKWGKQNYLATTSTPMGSFWLDGFRQADGRVRQWLFTEETARGVAAHVLGDARQYAVAFAVYRSVAPKPVYRPRPAFHGGYVDSFFGVSKSAESFGARRLSASSSLSASARLEVAAGALIKQFVYDDQEDLTFWNQTPVGIVILSYAPDSVIRELVQAVGLSHNEGPLAGLPVGNP